MAGLVDGLTKVISEAAGHMVASVHPSAGAGGQRDR